MLADMNDDERIEIAVRETAYRGHFRIDRYRLRHKKHDGGWSEEITREVFERGHAAGALLYDPQRDEIVLVEQFRLPAHIAGRAAWQIEIPAGMIGEGETPEEVTRREITEETGLTAIGELVPIHDFLPTPGGSTETVALFCARVDAAKAGGIFGLQDEHEDIKVVVLSYDEAMARALAGKIDNGFTLLCLWWLKAHRDDLRERWLRGEGER
jgi:ADP-ribose pyrophosphatase